MKNFSWGKVIETFCYNFNGNVCVVIKYYQWKRNGCQILIGEVDYSKEMYHSEQLNESFENIYTLLVAYLVSLNYGTGNNYKLVYAMSKMLGFEK